ncbi:hypothetical protein [Pelosinus sp. sgz500959]|uniref:hypothetical protein n=1 Tax=Pelosinus sp. sgz500959 TaxID=3242472 RepID=UPI00366EEAEA
MSGSTVFTPGVITPQAGQPLRQFRCILAPGIWYYDRWEETTNPPEAYKFLISNAQREILIWDPYINPQDIDFFINIPQDVSVKGLTCFGSRSRKEQELISRSRIASRDWNFHINVKYYDKSIDGGDNSDPFHDRYLFVDERVFMVGASIGHHHQRLSTNAIVEIIDSNARALVRHRFDKCWNHSYTKNLFSFEGGVFIP